MKYIGEYIPEFYGNGTWDHGNYMLCPADTADEEMECLYYEPVDAVTWMCKHCGGDHCRVEI